MFDVSSAFIPNSVVVTSSVISDLMFNGNAPAGLSLNNNQFYVDASHNNWSTISAATGVPVADLVTANPGTSIVSQLTPGTIVKLPAANNSEAPTLVVTPNPVAQTKV